MTIGDGERLRMIRNIDGSMVLASADDYAGRFYAASFSINASPCSDKMRLRDTLPLLSHFDILSHVSSIEGLSSSNMVPLAESMADIIPVTTETDSTQCLRHSFRRRFSSTVCSLPPLL
jgi:hypothetical protein